MAQRNGARRAAAVAAAIAIAAALLWWRTRVEPVPEPPRIGERAAAAATPATATTNATGESDPATVAPTAMRSTAELPAAPQRATVQVVDEHGAPVAGARVQWTTRDWEGQFLDFAPFDVEAEVAREPAAATDVQGLATLAIDAPSAFVWARDGNRFGQAMLWFDDPLLGPPRLEIRRDVAVHAVVQGPAGEPFANVLVAARFRAEESLDDPREHVELGRSGADGRVQLIHAQCLSFWTPADPRLELAAIVLGAAPAWIPCRLDGDGAVLELPCPLHGAVRLHLPGRGRVDRPVATLIDPDEHGLTSSDNWEGTIERSGNDAVVHPIALRRRWQLRASGCRDLELDGPVAHGQVLTATLWPREDATTLRVLAPDGTPLVDGDLQSHAHDADGRERLRTDARGDLRLAPRGHPTTLRLESVAERAEATIEIPVLPGGRAFVATVRLQPQQPVATGRVVDAANGDPLRAWVRLRGDGDFADRTVRAAADGSFVVYGVRPGPFSLRADLEGYAPAQRDGDSGEPLRIALVCEARLAVTVLLDPEAPLAELDLHVEGSTLSGWTERAGRRDAFVRLPPDTTAAVLEVRPMSGMPAITRVPRDQWQPVSGGFRTTVDLRGQLAAMTLDVRCNGIAVPADVFLLDALGEWWNVAASGCRIALRRDAEMPAIIVPPGHGCVAATLRPGANVVEVPAPATLRIRLGGAPRDVPEHALVVELWQLAVAEPELARALAEDAPRVAVWPLAAAHLEELDPVAPSDDGPPGSYRLARRGTYAAVPAVERADAVHRLLEHAVRVDVSHLGSAHDVLVDVPPDVVRAAYAGLGRAK